MTEDYGTPPESDRDKETQEAAHRKAVKTAEEVGDRAGKYVAVALAICVVAIAVAVTSWIVSFILNSAASL